MEKLEWGGDVMGSKWRSKEALNRALRGMSERDLVIINSLKIPYLVLI